MRPRNNAAAKDIAAKKKQPKPVEKCGKCQDPVLTDDEDEDIECTSCKTWYHHLCCGLTPAQFRRTTQDDDTPFTCQHCVSKNRKSLTSNKSEISEILEIVKILPRMEDSLKFLSGKYDDLLEDFKELKSSYNRLKKDHEEVKHQLGFLDRKVKSMDEERTKNACVITRIPGSNEVNFKAREAVINICQAVNVPITERDIDFAFVKKNRDSSKQQSSLVVKFASFGVKRDLMIAKKTLGNTAFKEVKVFDQLSEDKLKIYNHAINLRKTGYKHLYHQGGKIYVKKEDNDRPTHVQSMEHVDRLLSELDRRRSSHTRNPSETSSI